MKLENDFSQNIADGTLTMKFTKSQLDGLEENILKTVFFKLAYEIERRFLGNH